jgi:Leu/Phe-tRNA-protein transferase
MLARYYHSASLDRAREVSQATQDRRREDATAGFNEGCFLMKLAGKPSLWFGARARTR